MYARRQSQLYFLDMVVELKSGWLVYQYASSCTPLHSGAYAALLKVSEDLILEFV